MMKSIKEVFGMNMRDVAKARRLKSVCQAALLIALTSLAWGCRSKSSAAPASLFPESGEVSGWTKSGEARTFDAKGLWEYVDGDAERYIQAGVSKTLTSDYRYQDKVDAVADIYQMSAPAGAQKIFSAESSTDSQPVQVGDEGRLFKGSLVFRRGSYLVRLTAYEESPEVSKGLVDLARGIESRLGKAGA